MTRILAAVAMLGIAAAPALACPWNQSVEVQTPTTTAAAQPPQTAPCPTCVVPDNAPASAPAPHASGAPG